VAIGARNLLQNTSGYGNIAVGTFGFFCNTTGCGNVGIGTIVGNSSVSGCDNVAIGQCAFYSSVTGNCNVVIGRCGAFGLNGGSNNILIGAATTPSSATVSNTVTLGNSLITVVRAAVTTITSLSDARDKTDVTALPIGLDFINSLNPVKFTWQQREPNEVKDGTTEAGFIAQELQAAQSAANADYLDLVYDENPDKLEASPGKLIPVLVKAIQELSAEVKELKAQLASNG
jgi:hypothetical protein